MSIDIDVKIWGKPGWIFLENVAKGYPNHPTAMDKNNYKIMYESLKNTLPCSKCRNNYRNHLREFPINNYLHSRKTLLTWIRLVKNKSNPRRLVVEKSHDKVYEDRVKRIQNRRNGGCKTCGSNRKR